MIGARRMICLAAAGFVGAALVIATIGPAHAQPVAQPVTVEAHRSTITQVVPYGDLSLVTKEGRKMLLHRISMTVNELCPMFDNQGFANDVPACQDGAWRSAGPQIRQAFNLARTNAALAMSITLSAPRVK